MNANSAPKRFCYKIEKGSEVFFGYLFDDNIRYWISRGYTVTRNGENLH